MKILFYSIKDFERVYLDNANNSRFAISFVPQALSLETADLAKGFDAISIFANDDASAPVVRALKKNGVKHIAIRAAGYDNVDIAAANEVEIIVANVPEYSPNAIAEHAVLMMLALDRKIVLSQGQVKKQNFSLDNLIGFDLHKKKVGIIGTGKIGSIVAKILHGFGCTILAHDADENQHLLNKYDVHYVGLNTILSMSDIITLHIPLTNDTKYLINSKMIRQMKKGVMLINTARGGVVKTEDVLSALESGQIGYYGMDVYEKEKGIFFYDHSNDKIDDPLLFRLMNLPNVLITPHQAFATHEALTNIASTSFDYIYNWSINGVSKNELTCRKVSERLVP
jgi:D-lactate dehydrogenase